MRREAHLGGISALGPLWTRKKAGDERGGGRKKMKFEKKEKRTNKTKKRKRTQHQERRKEEGKGRREALPWALEGSWRTKRWLKRSLTCDDFFGFTPL